MESFLFWVTMIKDYVNWESKEIKENNLKSVNYSKSNGL